MTNSLTLAHSIDIARHELEASGRVSLPRRRAIWRAMYPDVETKHGCDIGHRRLVLLDILTVQRVMPLWHAVFPSDDSPASMLRIALDIAFGRSDPILAEKTRDSLYVDIVENRIYAKGQEMALFVGHAAANTITTALFQGVPDENADVDDEDLDPESFEPSMLAAAAEAGGLPWAEATNREKERAFWDWYLGTAITRAYEMTGNPA
ncbi:MULTISPECIES: Imm5 family immunity protein [unclassified Acidiphilium]|uniref:Imm5 family immunity protein n=1 Tax=unclassified Acidiphilium TaxID=2617493 RepID=UPI0025B87320|nr:MULTISPECIES: Imm5 family immunity protein [unclassified Acidiphilium]HQT62365.1 Imm5 family immunity protein [Acidiphilium sp.]